MGGTKEVWVAASALSAVLAGYSDADAAVRSGKAGYVRAGVTALAPGQAPVRINVGDPVFSDQKLVTDENGRIAVMMLDRSTLTLGPNSEVTISQYEYDQKQRTGSMALEAAKGFFRFVGGFLSKRKPVRIRTAAATIGIRGADVTMQLLGNGRARLIFNSGIEATVQPDGGEEASITEPGQMIEFSFSGPGELSILEASQDDIAAAMSAIYGAPGARIPIGSISDEDFALLQRRLEEDSEISIEELEAILGIGEADSLDLVIDTLDELGAEAGGTGGF